MPYDNTPYFKARTKLLAARLGQHERSGHSEAQLFLTARENYLHYSNTLKQLAKNLLEFHQLVRAKQPGYLSFNSPFTHTTDKERDKFDADTEKALKQMKTLLSSTSQAVVADKELKKLAQGYEHLSHVVSIVREQLKHLANQITTMRKNRLKHVTNRRTFGSLRGLAEHARARGIELEPKNANLMRKDLTPAGDNEESTWKLQNDEKAALLDNDVLDTWTWKEDTTSDKTDVPTSNKREEESSVLRKRKQNGNNFEEDNKPELPDMRDLSDKERTQLTLENEQMYAKFSQANVEIDHLETQISEIQHLQATFAERLLEQEKDIDHVHEIAVHTTENLRDGNEWIREAISDSASRRVIVLFCIIVITFALLFIDWYNP
ncbi:unnamed protein product, partial [Mesorhabditis belari]|uniref:Syntaxin-18 n=1 Tax=Mesorhabditis belari TaxID=2138241 RepID=A0AAF3ELJ8_9BILA